jgi:hypothetical protein
MRFPIHAYSMFAPVFRRPEGLLVRSIADDIDWSMPASNLFEPFLSKRQKRRLRGKHRQSKQG